MAGDRKSLFRNILLLSPLNPKIWRDFPSNPMIPIDRGYPALHKKGPPMTSFCAGLWLFVQTLVLFCGTIWFSPHPMHASSFLELQNVNRKSKFISSGVKQDAEFDKLGIQLRALSVRRQVGDTVQVPTHVDFGASRSLGIEFIYDVRKAPSKKGIIFQFPDVMNKFNFPGRVKEPQVKIDIYCTGLQPSRLVDCCEERVCYDSRSTVMFNRVLYEDRGAINTFCCFNPAINNTLQKRRTGSDFGFTFPYFSRSRRGVPLSGFYADHPSHSKDEFIAKCEKF